MLCVHAAGVNLDLRDTSAEPDPHLAPPSGESVVRESTLDASGGISGYCT